MDGTPSQPADSAAELHFEGKPAAGHTLPAETLAGYLTSLQRLVLLEAARQGGLPLAKKFRASASLKERHVLRCGIPTEGGYRQPLIEVNESAPSSKQWPTTIPPPVAKPSRPAGTSSSCCVKSKRSDGWPTAA